MTVDKKNVESENSGVAEDTASTLEGKATDSAIEPEAITATATEPEPVPAEQETKLIKEFSIEIKQDVIERQFDETLEKYSAEIKLPGFRKGKVPIDVIKSRFKDSIMDEAKHKLVTDAVFDKIKKDNIKIVSEPEIVKIQHEAGTDLTAEIRVEVLPEVVLPDLDTITVEIPAKDLESQPYDEEKIINAFLQERQRQQQVSDREIRDNDYVVISFQSRFLDTKRMTPRKESYFHALQAEKFEILDLYADVIGKKPGDTFTITRTYPETYDKKVWAGKQLEHLITIMKVYEWVTPVFDEAFVKEQGFDSIEQYKQKMQEEFNRQVEKNKENTRVGSIIDKVCQVVDFPVPARLVDMEARHMVQHFANQHFQAMPDENSAMAWVQAVRGQAEKSVRFDFIVNALADQFDLEVTGDDLEAEYRRAAENTGANIKDIRKYYLKKENLDHLKESLRKTKAINLLKEKIQVKEV